MQHFAITPCVVKIYLLRALSITLRGETNNKNIRDSVSRVHVPLVVTNNNNNQELHSLTCTVRDRATLMEAMQ